MWAIDEVKKDHKAIAIMLRVVDTVVADVATGAEVPISDLRRIFEFFEVFMNKYHRSLEEQMLKPGSSDPGDTQVAALASGLVTEHAHEQNILCTVERALANWRPEEPSTTSQLLSSLRDYVAFTRNHIQKEDEEVFPLLEKYFTPTADEYLQTCYGAITRDALPNGTAEQIAGTLAELSRKYLNEEQA